MALSNYERVGKALELLKQGLSQYIEREVKAHFDENTAQRILLNFTQEDHMLAGKPVSEWDVAACLNFMFIKWNDIFRTTLGNAERSIVGELREYRNRWAHQNAFSGDDAYRVLDSSERLLSAISASEAEELEKMKNELLRIRFDEQLRNEKRKSLSSIVESAALATLKPWREVISPHKDVASGRYQQAEFAADLWQVHLGEGSPEYRDPVEFFRRTYLTESLKKLLVNAIQRLSGNGGDPVVQLQTNFGGGKTHSMLALYHLFSGVTTGELIGVDELLNNCKVTTLPKVKRVVLVGNKISPGNPQQKHDGTVVRTLWGELAWQLGGSAAYDRIAEDDRQATNPGDTLRELFNTYGPVLILIDEWVAYARQLHDQGDLPAGSFETHFSFAQALTEAARTAKQCLLVISLPASDTAGSPHTIADDVEVGGERGREALNRLRNIVGRMESSWRPASTEEGFEIVRRRLFEPMRDPKHFNDRDLVIAKFSEFYQQEQHDFPNGCGTTEYENRMKAAYPIHPEVFDRLYSDWSTLLKFQRTRGVLRLMAAVIHCLWENVDKNPLIMPATIPLDDPRVQSELTRYLSDNWAPIIEKDIDGPSSLPLKIDAENTNLGKLAATRRVARTIFLGSAPTAGANNHGLEDRQIKLGCVMPGESPAIFSDALRHLAASATYLYQDKIHFWYSTQPTVTKLADDRAEQLLRNPDVVSMEIENRLRQELKEKGDFERVHVFPKSSQEVFDSQEVCLVVLDTIHTYTKDSTCTAMQEAKRILETRGSAPRIFQNMVIFLVADANRLQELDKAVRRYLAWKSICDEKVQLNLTPFQVGQAEQQLKSADTTVTAQIPETYMWLLVPVQAEPPAPIKLESVKLGGSETLAIRASKKLKNDELLVVNYAPSRLRMDMDRIPLWDGNHVGLKNLLEYYNRYVYLTRVKSTKVIIDSIKSGISLVSWETDSFAWADGWDDVEKRYKGLRYQQVIEIDESSAGLLVKPVVALEQIQRESKPVRIEIVPKVSSIKPQGSIQFTIEAFDRENRKLQIGNAHWDTTGGEIQQNGIYVAPQNPGEYRIRAEYHGIYTELPITVNPDAKPAYPDMVAQVPQPVSFKRFHGSVELDTTRIVRDVGTIYDEVLSHLATQKNANVKVTLEIEAGLPEGVSDNLVRIISENAKALKFKTQGFERE
jgi:predicted AAA+ superfamily ATPase